MQAAQATIALQEQEREAIADIRGKFPLPRAAEEAEQARVLTLPVKAAPAIPANWLCPPHSTAGSSGDPPPPPPPASPAPSGRTRLPTLAPLPAIESPAEPCPGECTTCIAQPVKGREPWKCSIGQHPIGPKIPCLCAHHKCPKGCCEEKCKSLCDHRVGHGKSLPCLCIEHANQTAWRQEVARRAEAWVHPDASSISWESSQKAAMRPQASSHGCRAAIFQEVRHISTLH